MRKPAKSRPIFEEVTAPRAAPSAKPGEADARKRRARRWVSGWLFALAALVAAMVQVGGMTRLTDSGLAMVSWHPVLEAVPPLTEAEWSAEFEKYKATEQYRVVNYWMALPDFKKIYWWEWGHRQFGRVIGVVWGIGLIVFLVRRMVPPGYFWSIVTPGLLGAVQALVGWWMVRSGVEEGATLISVAPYRLMIHLGLAFAIFGLLLWPGWRLLREDWTMLQARRRRAPAAMALSGGLIALVFLQILLGALVAGNDAGRGYVDWPLMNGAVLPPESFELSPWWRNLVENAALTQFNHRVAGYALALAALVYWVVVRRWRMKDAGFWAAMTALAVWLQMGWGIITVTQAAPLWLSIVHQAGALATLGIALRARFVAAYPAEQSVRR